MRRVPKDVHREVLQRDEREHGREPSWYAVWLGPPHGKRSELIGRTERLPTPRWWRAFPVTGEYPVKLYGWIAVTDWLLEVRESHQKAAKTERREGRRR